MSASLWCCHLDERGNGCTEAPTLLVHDAAWAHADRYSHACARHAHLLIDDEWTEPTIEPLAEAA